MDSPSQLFTSIAVIVIEDSEDDYRLLLRKLRATSLQVEATRVQNAAELREALALGYYDAVIADHRLPTFTSFDALKQVREVDPDLPFLIVSGTIGEDLAVEAMRAGADDYLLKERLGRLLPALERALKVAANRRGRRRAEAALKESEFRFRALTENLPGMVFQMQYSDEKLALLYVSEGSLRVLGVAPGVLLAQPSLLFDSLAPADAEKLRDALAESVATAPFVGWDGALDSSPGEDPRWIEIAARSRKLASGAVLWDGIVTEITAAKQAEQALRGLASHLTRVREEEREAVARELHDDVGSTLTAVKFELASLKNAPHQEASVTAKLREVDQLVDAVITSSTRITHDLRPGIIDEGLVASLEWQARAFEQRMGIPCSFKASQEEIVLERVSAVAMFRVCQEALNNIAKHAHATRVDVSLDATDDVLMLEIHDNGKGIAAADMAKRSCYGLRGMKERANSLGGEVEIRSDGGTTITFSLFPDSPPTGKLSVGSEP
jgi:signal transduction histidine kinase/CheY-like chemotaxis protein